MGCLWYVDGHQSFPQSEGRNFLADKRFSGFVASEGQYINWEEVA